MSNGPEHVALQASAADLVAELKRRSLTIATAEATTGGLIGHLITSIPGSSAVFRAGVAPYWNDAKLKLGVSKDVLEEHGAVSDAASRALAAAICSWTWADIGLAETGIAGPTGGTERRPAGRFWIAVAGGGSTRCEHYDFAFDREGNLRACAEAALKLALACIQT